MKNGKRQWLTGLALLGTFMVWTVLIRVVDVRPVGPNGSRVGFAACNVWFHRLTGVHMTLYTITDWLGLAPMAVCLCFGAVGLVQWVRRRRLLRVDGDILLLGGYYILVIFGYLFFEMVPVNYRPILINGVLEASYPSSTTLLVLSVMPTLVFQTKRRLTGTAAKNCAAAFAVAFSVFMVVGRLIAGVHWATDIIGAVLLSAGLFELYRAAVTAADRRHNREG